MKKKDIAFDTKKYLKIQKEEILKRIKSFDGKLYLEFGGKLFDDNHAARVLPGFESDSKLQLLLSLREKAEIVIVINANDIENSKARSDIGVKYENEVKKALLEKYNYSSVMQIPALSKIVINIGVGDATQDSKRLEYRYRRTNSVANKDGATVQDTYLHRSWHLRIYVRF